MAIDDFGYDKYKPDIQYNNPYLWPGYLSVTKTPPPREPCSNPQSWHNDYRGQTSSMNDVLMNGQPNGMSNNTRGGLQRNALINGDYSGQPYQGTRFGNTNTQHRELMSNRQNAQPGFYRPGQSIDRFEAVDPVDATDVTGADGTAAGVAGAVAGVAGAAAGTLTATLNEAFQKISLNMDAIILLVLIVLVVMVGVLLFRMQSRVRQLEYQLMGGPQY
jgi:hypothetical protein